MSISELVAILAIVLALAFDFVNGFHDTANAVATVIYTKTLKPRSAIIMSGLFNFAGAVLVGTAVAKVITHIIPQDKLSLLIVLAVLIAGLIWNILTWYFGIPVSSSHCLIGSLFGAGIAAGGWHGVSWAEFNKVCTALLISPVAGFIGGGILTWIAVRLARSAKGSENSGASIFKFAQILSSASVSFSHGGNDGQKTMGIITLILAIAFPAAGYSLGQVPFWVMVAAALAMGIGTTIGGGRVIKTIGEKLTRGQWHYTHGFGAEVSTAMIISAASLLGAPISTTHTLTSAVAGGTVSSKGAGHLNTSVLKTIILAWLVTLPAVALISAASYLGLHSLFPNSLNMTIKPLSVKEPRIHEPIQILTPSARPQSFTP